MSPMQDKFKDAVLEDLVNDPASFGAPSFQDFCKDPDRYRFRKDHLLAIADDGSKLEGLKKRLGVTRWEIDGYRFDTPEQVENYCRDEGLDLNEDVDFKPCLIEGISGKIDLVNVYKRKVPVTRGA